MRSDARALLQKLNQQGFQYQQFPDPYADLELWPVFEALLHDERVVGQQLSRVQQREHEFQAVKEQAAARPKPVQAPEEHPLEEQFSALLASYAPGQDPPVVNSDADEAEQTGQKVDLRTFLKELGGARK